MERFDLSRALSGEKVVTQSGNEVFHIFRQKTPVYEDFPIAGIVYSSSFGFPYSFSENGIAKNSDIQLFMK